MMDGEDVYRVRLADCLAAAAASPLPQVRDKHLAAARSWQALLDATLERKANAAAARQRSDDGAAEAAGIGDAQDEGPETAADAPAEGMPAVKAFRQSSGRSRHDVAADAGLTEARLAEIERGTAPHGLELAVLSDVLDVPVDRLVDEGSKVSD